MKEKKFFLYLVATVFATFGVSIAIQSLMADWTPPPNTPPGGNPSLLNSLWTESGSDIYRTSGNVGIGTMSPVGTLDVAGNIVTSNTQRNIKIGQEALGVSTGGFNVAVGNYALADNADGRWNVAVGPHALNRNTTGYGNIAIGEVSLMLNESGYGNVAIGKESLNQNSFGNSNTAVGAGSLDMALGSGNVALGYLAGSGWNGSNALFIDNSNTSNPLIGGDFLDDIVNIEGALNVSEGLNVDGSIFADGFVHIGTDFHDTDYKLEVEGNIKSDNFATYFAETPHNLRGTSMILDSNKIMDLCSDSDGCDVRLQMYNWSNGYMLATRPAHLYVLYVLTSSGRRIVNWRMDYDNTSVSGAIHSGGVTSHHNWSCYFTEGDYNNWNNLGDVDDHFSLLSWNEFSAEHCRITFID